ncbi:accessory Sec system glycosyltransferase Asp1 [Fructilactobacillus carniphilus]|uniref:Accessory Sec system glycosyltransferase Asp1 n=1 Tax=Fructilactobacillus carniphilus TaxID=2940297 RepID=A0ABY5BU41_9LACO|nr:accessory Sec system glycosyltransferase Asp1 [Fructilactobacillus carniphilus]USS90021.1 accessory Sec system glycosyltransferase Asp1 [Fructilactobacillus carniphilus]
MVLIIPNFADRQGQPLEDLPEVVLAQMLLQTEQPVELAFLQPTLSLRRDLQELGMPDIPYWDAFADLQEVHDVEGMPVTIHDLTLSGDLIPFFNVGGNRILLYREQKLVAEVQTRNQIEVERITHYCDDGGQQLDEYSADGFLSTTTWLNLSGEVEKKAWFTPFHEPVFTMGPTGNLSIEADFQSHFKQPTYACLEDLVQERYQKHFQVPKQVIVAYRAGATQTNQFHLSLPAAQTVGLLETGVDFSSIVQLSQTYPQLQWVFPSQKLVDQFQQTTGVKLANPVTAIEPYPTTFSPGGSNELEAQLVYWQIQQQTAEQLAQTVQILMPELLANDKLVLLVGGDEATQNFIRAQQDEWMTTELGVDVNGNDYQSYIELGPPKNFQTEAEWLDYIDDQITDDDAEFNEADLHHFYQASLFNEQVQYLKPKEQTADLFRRVRLFLDMGPQADLKRQVEAISAGVPMISTAPTDLIKEAENGFENQNLFDLAKQMNYFLSNLQHWNQAVVASVDLMEAYERDQLLGRWKGVLDHG